MKRFTLFTMLAFAGLLITGCKDKSADTTTSNTDSQPSSTQTATKEISKAASTAATEVGTEVKKQAAEVVAEAQKQARAVYDDLSKQLMENTQAKANDLMKQISADLQTRVTDLGESLKSNETLMEQLNGAVQALLNNKDVDAVGAFNKVAAAKLTPEQTTLAKDVYNAAAAFVTERNFSSLEGMNSEVSKLATSVWKGNYTEALQPLQTIYSKSTLTTEQKDLLGAVFDDYLPGWQEKAGALQKGLDTLKTFGQ